LNQKKIPRRKILKTQEQDKEGKTEFGEALQDTLMETGGIRKKKKLLI